MSDLLERINSLSPEKRELLLQKIHTQQKGAINKLISITPVARNQPIFLSFAQQRLWLLHQLRNSVGAYNISGTLFFRGNLNIEALKESFREIIHRHEVLRTTFTLINDSPEQVIHSEPRINWQTIDWQEIPESQQKTQLQHLMRQESQFSFNLEKDSLVRLVLVKLSPVSHILLVTMHHIIADGWSIGRLFEELSTLYQVFAQKNLSPLAPLTIQYADYAVWQREWVNSKEAEKQLNYWQKKLANATKFINFPTDYPRPGSQNFRGATYKSYLSPSLINSLKKLSHQQDVTLFVTLLTTLKILIFKWTKQQDLVVGTVIAGRNRVEIEPLIGCFMNFLALRSQISEKTTINQLLKQENQTVLEAYSNQDYPFEKIVEVINPERNTSYNPIYNVAILLQNFPRQPFFSKDLEVETTEIEKDIALLDQRWEITEAENQTILKCEYSTELFTEVTIEELVKNYITLLKKIVEKPEIKIAELEISQELENHAKKAREREKKQTLVLAASFTADPIAAAINYWLEKLNLPIKLEFAPYNQIFQELLNPKSLLRSNQEGVNLILIRPEDWVRFEEKVEDREKIAEKMRQTSHELIAAIQKASQNSQVPLIVVICPQSPQLETEKTALIDRLEALILAQIKPLQGVNVISPQNIQENYPLSNYYDRNRDEIGHIPYTETYYTALGTAIARQIYALKHPPYKVIALDCDNTLWSGICGEDGATGVKIDPGRQALQEFLVEQQQRGKLLCLCSKNQEADVWAVFAANPTMPLKKEHLVAWKINWQSKSANLKALGQELNLGLDSFIFIDDNPIECEEVALNSPEILSLQLPEDTQNISQWLKHIWAFDQGKTTAEDQKRTQLYQENRAREELRKSSLSIEEFLASLNLDIKIEPLNTGNLERVAQLTERTNQFNLTTIRRSVREIQQLWEQGKLEGRGVSVKDRFGDYGLVGVLLFSNDAISLTVDTFLLSCRVLGRGVETQMLKYLGKLAQEKNLNQLNISYYPTAKNQPVLDFLEKVGRENRQKTKKGWLYQLSIDSVINLSDSPDELNTPSLGDQPSSEVTTKVRIKAPSKLLTQIATELVNPVEILREIEARQQQQRSEEIGEFVAPRHPIEEQLALIWQEVLKVDRVGIYDNFFELGGTSLLATQVVSRLREIFAKEMALEELFEASNIDQLQQKLQEKQVINTIPIKLVERNQKLPLSFAQQRLWFLDQLEGKNAAYNEGGAVQLTGHLDQEVLQQSLAEIIRRHEILRTNFQISEDVSYQAIAENKDLIINKIDLSNCTSEQQSEQLQQIIKQQFQTPFQLEQDLLLRVTWLELAENSHILLVVMHHIVCDGWSFGVLLRELSALYQAYREKKPSPLPDLKIQYVDYACWQREWLQGEQLQQQIKYWQEKLTGLPPLLELPTDKPRPPIQSFKGSYHQFSLNRELSQKLKQLSQKSGVTLFMTLLSAFSILLSRYSRQEDIAIGSPIANRNRAEIEPLIGFFVNTLVMRVNLEDNPTVNELLQQIRKTCLDAYSHQDVPFEKLVEELKPERNLSYTPLFQVIFALQNAPIEELSLPGLTLSPVEIDSGIAKFDLTLSMVERENRLEGTWEYNTDLFEPETIERMIGQFQVLLEGMVANPAEKIGKLPLLTEAERNQILVEWNNTAAEYPKDKSIHELFEEQIEKTPDAVAVVYEEEQLTYQELNQKANQLAHYLQKLGVKPDTLVGICVERSLEMIIGLLGILKAGGAYVPIDPNYPAERIEYMLKDSSVSVLLTQEQLIEQLPQTKSTVIRLDEDWTEIENESDVNLNSSVTAENLAYVIYTSGSTGQPKGVSVCHKSINRLVRNTNYINIQSSHRIAQASNNSFDAATFEIWGALLNGAKLIGCPKEVLLSSQNLSNYLQSQKISTLFITTALFNQIAKSHPDTFSTLDHLLFGGEAVDPYSVIQVATHNPPQNLIHVYGPTENTTFSSWYLINPHQKENNRFPIGKPITNTQIYILDPNLQAVPIGVLGELHIGGDGLARGYLNRPELTEEKFILNPFDSTGQSKLYKTGDLCRYLPDGNIEYIGRIDHQVKIRGFRIELGEIESILTTHPDIRDSVVIAREDQPGNKRLVAYLVSNLIPDRLHYVKPCQLEIQGQTYPVQSEDISTGGLGINQIPGKLPVNDPVRVQIQLPGEESATWLSGVVIEYREGQSEIQLNLTNQEQDIVRKSYQWLKEELGIIATLQRSLSQGLREYLQGKLPDYMIPSSFVLLENLPLTPNGKIDRKALPAPDWSQRTTTDEFVAPQTFTQQILASIWENVLNIESVSLTDNFFELGGHSLLATQVISRIRDVFEVEIPLRTLFDTPCFQDLVREIEANKNRQKSQHTHPIIPFPRPEYLPLSVDQKRLWFLSQLVGDSLVSNNIISLKLEGNLDINALKQSLQDIYHRHESLRTSFILREEQPIQNIEAEITVILPIIELQRLTPSEQNQEIERISNEETGYQFNLSNVPLIREKLLILGDKSYLLLLTIHHIIFDNLSAEILLQELSALYLAYSQKQLSPLSELRLQYADYTLWQLENLASQEVEQNLEYWKQHLANIPSLLELPLDRPRPQIPTHRGQVLSFKLGSETTQKLKQLSQRLQVTLFMTLMAAFALLLNRLSHQDNIVIGTPFGNRNRTEFESLIGFFAFPLPLHIKVSDDLIFEDWLKQVRQLILEAYTHQNISLSQIVDSCVTERSLSHNPLFQVLFTYLGQQMKPIALPHLTVKQVLTTTQVSTEMDLGLNLYESEDELAGIFVYLQDLFAEETVQLMADAYCGILEQCVKDSTTIVSDFSLPQILESKVEKAKARKEQQQQTIVIASTFTCEPVETSLNYWIGKLNYPYALKFAAYNQVFQELLNPQSSFTQNLAGINLILVRLEDWVRFDAEQHNGEHFETKIRQNTQDLISAIRSSSQRLKVPLMVIFCPPSTLLKANPTQDNFLARMEALFVGQLKDLDRVCIITSKDIAATYPVPDYYDVSRDELGHIPYSETFYAALGTMIARQLYALNYPSYKVIALDCDHTLWSGFCAEDQLTSVRIDPARQVLQKFLIEQQKAGKLLCLCSKNEEKDVWKVFDNYSDMLLQKEHLISWKINRQSQSENLKALAEELNLGLDCFILIDNNPVECAEVKANCPEVLTLQLPENLPSISSFLQHIWAFDQIKMPFLRDQTLGFSENDSDILTEIGTNFVEPDQILQIIHQQTQQERAKKLKEFVLPQTSTQQDIANIWCEVLRIESIGIYDEFFEAGGNSISATQVISRMRDQFAYDFPLRALFEQPTIAELAHSIDTTRSMLEKLQSVSDIPEDQLDNIEEFDL